MCMYLGIIDDLIHMDAAEVILATKLVAETTLNELLVSPLGGQWEGLVLWYSCMTGSVHNSVLVMSRAQ